MAVCLFQHRGNIQRLIAGTEAKIQMSMGKMVAALVTVGVIILGILVLFYV
jgi:hypothetical protein